MSKDKASRQALVGVGIAALVVMLLGAAAAPAQAQVWVSKVPQAVQATMVAEVQAPNANVTAIMTPVEKPAAVPQQEFARAKVVTVVTGDTLSRIAQRNCGSQGYWPGLWQANPTIQNPDLIYPGQQLTVSCVRTEARASRSSARSTATAPAPSGSWVHPLAAGTRALSSGGCWGADRGDHAHQGVDLTIGSGTPIRAAHAGVIKSKRWDNGGGNYVVVDHGGVYTIYMHMRQQSFRGVGERVGAGDTIGYVGSTGHSTGPHLHFEVHRGGLWGGYRINPAPFMRDRGVNIGC